jgi:hypothetical protein
LLGAKGGIKKHVQCLSTIEELAHCSGVKPLGNRDLFNHLLHRITTPHKEISGFIAMTYRVAGQNLMILTESPYHFPFFYRRAVVEKVD